MRIHRHFTAALALLLLNAAGAAAQDPGKIGVTMGFPASFGIVWHATDSVAIRPELSLTGNSSSGSAAGIDIEGDTVALGTGVSVLFYVHKYDRLRTYFSPRFTWSHSSSSTTSSGVIANKTTSTANTATGAGSFGAQYNLSDKFAFFGELGFGFGHGTSEPSATVTKVTSNTWGTRSAIGAIFYF